MDVQVGEKCPPYMDKWKLISKVTYPKTTEMYPL